MSRLKAVWPALLAVLVMRARFLFSPITSDEGGYLAIARGWVHGGSLYKSVWIDRPQGLLSIYAIWHSIGLGTPVGIRILAVLACAMAVVACADIARTLARECAALPAAFLVAVFASVPQYEGFIANAELLSGSIGAVALALALRAVWNRDSVRAGMLFSAGVVGGLAFSVKQSGFDALGAALVAAVVCGLVMPGKWRASLRNAALLTAGAIVPVVVMALHGALTGWHRWWYAFVGYRLDQRSALNNAQWSRLHHTFLVASPVVIPVVAVILGGLAWLWRSGRVNPRVEIVLASWLAFSAIAFITGGQYHLHYWVLTMFPLGTCAAIVLSRLPSLQWQRVLMFGVLVLPVVLLLKAWVIPASELGARLDDDARLQKDAHIASWYSAHRTTGSNIYALCASGGLYGRIKEVPPMPYLWFDYFTQIPAARPALISMMQSNQAPTFVAEYQAADTCDPTGVVSAVLTTKYHVAATIDGVHVYQRNDA
jgi:4-amino-4-deoxy-L-arabinose transferase-like glycosyltransferase